MVFDGFYFHCAVLGSFMLLPLMVDQLIKSSERLTEAEGLPLAACLMIFIFVSAALLKFMRLMLFYSSFFSK